MSMQELLPPIVATLMAAGLLLAERHRAAAEVERLRAIEQRRIEEERHQRDASSKSLALGGTWSWPVNSFRGWAAGKWFASAY